MTATILGILNAILSMANAMLSIAQQKQWMEAGAAEAAAQGVKDALEAIANAAAARVASHTGSVYDNDGYRRD